VVRGDPDVPQDLARAPRRRWSRRDTKGWIFVGPFLVVFAVTFLAPIGYAAYLSLFREQAFFGGSVFVGVKSTGVVCEGATA